MRHFAILATCLLTVALFLGACQQGSKSMSSMSSSSAFARVDGVDLTEKDLKNRHKMMIYQAESEAYRNKQGVVEDIVNEKLMDIEVKKAGISVDELKKREIQDKTPMATPSEAEEVYKQQEPNIKARFKQMNKPMPPKKEILEAIARDVTRRRAQERMQNYSRELQAAHKVEYLMKEPIAPRVEIAVGDNPAKGPESAKVTIIEFSDFQCPYCAKAVPVLKEIEQTYGDKVRVVFRDFPLSFHNTAKMQAEAANCANEQGKFWEMHDELFNNQNKTNASFSAGNENSLKKQLEAYAKDIGANPTEFAKCLDSKKYAKAVDDDMKAGEEAGVGSTPSFFVNGRPIAGALPFSEFKKVIDEELAQK